MRSSKLVLAVAAIATASLALLPAAAPAAKGPGHAAKRQRQTVRNGNCRLRIQAAPRFVQASEAAEVSGTLVCSPPTTVSGQTVTVYEHSAGSPGLSVAGTTTTDSSGNFKVPTPPLSTNSTFYATVGAAHSSHRAVKVMPKLTVSGPPDGAQLFTGPGPLKSSAGAHNPLLNVIRFSGAVSPTDAGAEVVLQRENTVGVEEWRRIARGVVDREGNYLIVHKFAVPGDANIRVVVRPSATNAAAASEPLSYEISQAQKPDLLIESSADPLSYGSPVTFTGTAASGPGTTLTLLSRTRAQSAFAPVATTVSGAGGKYSFAPQTPLQSTLYQVSGAGKTSAVVFEGVKYALTVEPPASSVQIGQPLTFAGTVTPAVAGHPIYLQVLNPSGIGFHVVQVGTVGADGKYSITHTIYNPAFSQRKFRVKVPGDPQNQGVASPLITVAVTAAPGPIAPESSTNSSQPHEGQV
jgi:hypothetical protein